VNRFSHVKNRDFISTTATYVLSDKANYEPDIIFCMADATLLHKDLSLVHTMYLLKGPSVPEGSYVRSPCDTDVHDTMFVFWHQSEAREISKIEDLWEAIEFKTNSTTPIWVILSAHNLNPYRERVLLNNGKADFYYYFNEANTHFVQPNETTAYISVFPRVLKGIKKNTIGLLGILENDFWVGLTSTVETLHTPGTTKFILKTPVMWQMDEEDLYVYELFRSQSMPW
jgi:hypothetical protein